MNKPGIFDGVTVALIIAGGAGAAGLLFGGFIVYGLLFEFILYAATLTYLSYLLRRSNARIGRVLAIAAWALVSAGGFLLDVALLEQALLQAGLVWLIRSLYFHDSLLAAALDFGLVSAGLAAGAWALLNTGSLAAALWSFFLVQALFCWLPGLIRRDGELPGAGTNPSAFHSAHRVAEEAVRKLSQI